MTPRGKTNQDTASSPGLTAARVVYSCFLRWIEDELSRATEDKKAGLRCGRAFFLPPAMSLWLQNGL